jgi:hypothetical protein
MKAVFCSPRCRAKNVRRQGLLGVDCAVDQAAW